MTVAPAPTQSPVDAFVNQNFPTHEQGVQALKANITLWGKERKGDVE